MICRNCGETINEGFAFCGSCGNKVAESPVATETISANTAPVAVETATVLSISGTGAEPVSDANEELASPPVPQPPASTAKRTAKAILAVMLGVSGFAFIFVFIALTVVRPGNIPNILVGSDITRILEETGLSEEIINGINDSKLSGINVDIDSLKDFIRRKNVANEVGNVAERYVSAVTDGDFDYYLTSREIVSFLRAIASDIRDEFDYRLTSDDYDYIANSLTTDVNLKDYRVGVLLDDADIDVTIPYLLLSVYPFLIICFICVLLVFNIFLLYRNRVRTAFSIASIPFILSGLLCLITGLLIGPFSGLFSGTELYGLLRAAAGIAGLLIMPGLICLGIGVIFLVAFIFIEKKWKQYQPESPSEKNKKVWRCIGLTTNSAVLIACSIFTVLFLIDLPEASANQRLAGNDNEQGITSALETDVYNNNAPSGDNGSDNGNYNSPSASPVPAVSNVRGGDIIPFGGYDWRVLDIQDGKALIISDRVLEHREYHTDYTEITWADSSLRQYLNGEFYNSFSASDRGRIAQVTNINPDNPWDFTEYGGNNKTPRGVNTQDRIFLLSLDEVVRYFGDSGQLRNQNHANNESWGFNDEYSGVRVASCLDSCTYNDYHYDAGYGTASWWWLRSPGFYSNLAAFVISDGFLYVYGIDVYVGSGGVRPALWLNL